MPTGPVGRREAVRLGVIGTAAALGHRVFVAAGQAQAQTLNDNTGPLWTMAVDVQGLPALSANVVSIDIDDLVAGEFDKPSKLGVDAVIRAKSTPEVRKEIRVWFERAHGKKSPARSITIVLTHRDGGKRGYTLHDVFPIRYSTGDYTTGAETNLEELHVKSTRVELA